MCERKKTIIIGICNALPEKIQTWINKDDPFLMDNLSKGNMGAIFVECLRQKIVLDKAKVYFDLSKANVSKTLKEEIMYRADIPVRGEGSDWLIVIDGQALNVLRYCYQDIFVKSNVYTINYLPHHPNQILYDESSHAISIGVDSSNNFISDPRFQSLTRSDLIYYINEVFPSVEKHIHSLNKKKTGKLNPLVGLAAATL